MDSAFPFENKAKICYNLTYCVLNKVAERPRPGAFDMHLVFTTCSVISDADAGAFLTRRVKGWSVANLIYIECVIKRLGVI